jgi:hypothetical protein
MLSIAQNLRNGKIRKAEQLVFLALATEGPGTQKRVPGDYSVSFSV